MRATCKRGLPCGAGLHRCSRQPRSWICSAASGPALLSNLQHAVNEELVIEGALHTTALQAGSCLTRFSELQQLAEGQAPPPLAVDVSHAKAAAVCIATPSEPNEEAENLRLMRAQLRDASNSINNLSNRCAA